MGETYLVEHRWQFKLNGQVKWELQPAIPFLWSQLYLLTIRNIVVTWETSQPDRSPLNASVLSNWQCVPSNRWAAGTTGISVTQHNQAHHLPFHTWSSLGTHPSQIVPHWNCQHRKTCNACPVHYQHSRCSVLFQWRHGLQKTYMTKEQSRAIRNYGFQKLPHTNQHWY